MLSSLGIQAGTWPLPANLSPQNPIFSVSTATPSSSCFPFHEKALKPVKISASSYPPNQEASVLDDENDSKQAKEKLGVVVKPMQRPRLMLKFIWMEKNIGIAIDQLIPGGRGTIPLSPYYFWPRKDAWEELKVMLEGKPWISKKELVVLLNQATDIINLWQQSGDLA